MTNSTLDARDSSTEVEVVEPEPHFALPATSRPFPRDVAGRANFFRDDSDGKKGTRVTPFQWRLYDLLLKVPPGKVSTYGQLSSILSSSPRAVGSALRNNPFAPFVPCHRIIATNGYVGGFAGEWNPSSSSSSSSSSTRTLKARSSKPTSSGRKASSSSKDRPGQAVVEQGPKVTEKLRLLRSEGVLFDQRGVLKDKSCWWKGP